MISSRVIPREQRFQPLYSNLLLRTVEPVSASQSSNSHLVPCQVTTLFISCALRPNLSNALKSLLWLWYLLSLIRVETYYGWPSVWHSYWNNPAFGKLFSMFDLYSGNTGCWRWNKTNTSYLLFMYLYSLTCETEEDFPTFHSVLSFSVSTIFGRLCLYKRLYCSCSFFHITLIHIVYFFVGS